MGVLPDLRAFAPRLFRWPVLIAWMVLIFALSSIPNEIAPSTPDPIPLDKVAHFGEFAVLGFLLAGIGLRYARGRSTIARAAVVLTAIAAAALYGASDEFHQRYVPGRDPSPGDWAADAAGSAMGALAAAVVFSRTPSGAGSLPPTTAGSASRRRAR
jgi:VanZ family protein